MNTLHIDKKIFGKRIKENVSLLSYTTLGIGGPADLLIPVNNEKELVYLVKLATKQKYPFMVIGEGSDLLVSDDGYRGLVIVNKIIGTKESKGLVTVSSGTNLQKFINYLIAKGYLGMEKMSGIPGTVGGAVYGNAGAYGQCASDHIVNIKALENGIVKVVKKEDADFNYRDSYFKKEKCTIISATFKFDRAPKEMLLKESLNILQMRAAKYPPTLKCPGSYFKNVIAQDLKPSVLKKVPADKIVFGKIPAGYLMEAVGAKGMKKGNIQIADYHGNLIFNLGGGNANDFIDLASTYAKKVEKRFGIVLEPEVQMVGF